MGSEYLCVDCLLSGVVSVSSDTQCSENPAHTRFTLSFITGDPSPLPPARYWLAWCVACEQHYAYNQQDAPVDCPLSHAYLPENIQERTTCPSCKDPISPSGQHWRVFVADDGSFMTAKVVN